MQIRELIKKHFQCFDFVLRLIAVLFKKCLEEIQYSLRPMMNRTQTVPALNHKPPGCEENVAFKKGHKEIKHIRVIQKLGTLMK